MKIPLWIHTQIPRVPKINTAKKIIEVNSYIYFPCDLSATAPSTLFNLLKVTDCALCTQTEAFWCPISSHCAGMAYRKRKYCWKIDRKHKSFTSDANIVNGRHLTCCVYAPQFTFIVEFWDYFLKQQNNSELNPRAWKCGMKCTLPTFREMSRWKRTFIFILYAWGATHAKVKSNPTVWPYEQRFVGALTANIQCRSKDEYVEWKNWLN